MIRWTMKEVGFFTMSSTRINAENCGDGRTFTDADRESMGFFLKAGNLTFLKNSTQLKIWFDDSSKPSVTWEYKDTDETSLCTMRHTMIGLKFQVPSELLKDNVSSRFRYEIGDSTIFDYLRFPTV